MDVRYEGGRGLGEMLTPFSKMRVSGRKGDSEAERALLRGPALPGWGTEATPCLEAKIWGLGIRAELRQGRGGRRIGLKGPGGHGQLWETPGTTHGSGRAGWDTKEPTQTPPA